MDKSVNSGSLSQGKLAFELSEGALYYLEFN